MIDLVAGYARGYNAEQIRPFLKSLRQTGYEGKILLFADGGAAKEAKNWDVDLMPCTKSKIKINVSRYLHLKEVLEKFSCEGILLADTRDAIFQKDPSKYLPSEGLNVFEEDRSKSIGTCPYNSVWIKERYGEEELEKIKTYPILCSGTTCGDYKSILSYLGKMCDEMKLKRLQRIIHDQAAHNFLIRKNITSSEVWLTTLRSWNNEEAEIYTVGYIQRGTVKFKNNKIINKSGKIPTVIHQWDRHQNLTNLIKVTL